MCSCLERIIYHKSTWMTSKAFLLGWSASNTLYRPHPTKHSTSRVIERYFYLLHCNGWNQRPELKTQLNCELIRLNSYNDKSIEGKWSLYKVTMFMLDLEFLNYCIRIKKSNFKLKVEIIKFHLQTGTTTRFLWYILRNLSFCRVNYRCFNRVSSTISVYGVDFFMSLNLLNIPLMRYLTIARLAYFRCQYNSFAAACLLVYHLADGQWARLRQQFHRKIDTLRPNNKYIRCLRFKVRRGSSVQNVVASHIEPVINILSNRGICLISHQLCFGGALANVLV